MTKAQIIEAIAQVKVHCDLLMANYEMVSMRGALYTLGYDSDQADEVLRYCADHGFEYCLDSHIKCSNGLPDGGQEYPSADVCYWGPDQLKSRLEFIR